MWRKHLISLSLLICFVFFVHAQDYLLNAIPVQEQLPVASIHVLMQDSEGYMWYGTRDGGLCRSDGYQIDIFHGGNSNHINALAEDYSGHLLFGTHDGLYAIDKTDYSICTIDSSLQGLDIDPILVASDSTLWVGAVNELRHYDSQWHLIARYPSIRKGQKVAPCRITEDSHGTLWVSQWGGGIVRYDRQTDAFVEQPWPDRQQPLNIVEDGNGQYWVGTWGEGIVLYEPAPGRVTRQPGTTTSTLVSQVIYLLHDPAHERLFASTMDGLKAYDIIDGRLQAVDLGDILPSGTGMTDYMMYDRDGNLWVGGFPPHTFVLSPKNSDIEKHTFPLFRQTGNDHPIIWNAAQEGDCIWFDQDREMLCLGNLKTGEVTFGKDARIPHFEHIRNNKFRRCKTQPGIWTYADNTVLHCWHEGMKICSEQVVETGSKVLCLYDDGEGKLYIGHSDGIERYDLQRHVLEPVSEQDNNAVRQVMQLAINEDVRSFDIDHLGHWWTVTDRQVREYDPVSGNYRLLSVSDNDMQMDFFCNVSAVGEQVRIDGAGGVLMVKPMSSLRSGISSQQPVVSGLIINGSKRLVGLGERTISIEPEDVHVEVQFSTLRPLHAQRISFAYRVEQIDDHWHYLPQGTNKAAFVRLPKGTYTFEVMATDEYGSWGEPAEVLTLRRLPAWYETWWAYVLYLLLAIVLTGLIIEVAVLRRRFRDFQRGEEVEVERVTGNKQDQQFLQKAVEVIEKNLSNDAYNIDAFAKDMFMSRTTLYRRIVSLTAQKPTEFIRTIRLKHAARLIHEGGHSLTEIGYICGFSSPSYFYRCFKAQYGVPPGNY